MEGSIDFSCALDGSRESVKWEFKSAGKVRAPTFGATHNFPYFLHELKVSAVKDVAGCTCMSKTIVVRSLDKTVNPRLKDA